MPTNSSISCTPSSISIRAWWLRSSEANGWVAHDEGRVFYVVLVRALLHAVEAESPDRAAFVEQLRSSWPSAVEAR